MSQANIDWNAIRPLHGSCHKGFEELCAQLALAESPKDSRFVRKGTPDAGVECYAILTDDSEWGWQAKYFTRLMASQWSQIDESVIEALETHPRLIRYFVCVPLDLSDGRDPRRKSAKEHWDDHVKKWTRLAADRGMTVEFVYWGSHEMIERLTQPKHLGRLRFWFDVHGFDEKWFSDRLKEALDDAGSRYTPEINVRLPISEEFEAFGRTERFFDRVKAQARKIREDFSWLRHSETSIDDPSFKAATISMKANVEAVLGGFAAIQPQPVGPLTFSIVADQAATAGAAVDDVVRIVFERQPAPKETFRDLRSRLHKLSASLKRARETLTSADHVAGRQLMVISGVAGSGKTHLLCDLAKQRVAAGQPTILLMGQRFMTSDAPWSQVLQQLDLSELSAEKFVGALEAAAQAADCRALVLIDALNEGEGRRIWPDNLAAFLTRIYRSPWIGVVLSVRSSYEKIVIPETVRADAHLAVHNGFAGHEYDATRRFFNHYRLELPSTPLLAPEFRNPLFLKTLCSGLHQKGKSRLPRGFQGITAVFELYLSAINDRLAEVLDFNPRKPLVRRAMEEFSNALINADHRWLPLDTAEESVNRLLPNRDYGRSLYRGLIDEGVLIEEAGWLGNSEIVVLITYERFADHLVAKALLDEHLDVNHPAAAFSRGGALSIPSNKKLYDTPGLLEALCIQVPERTGKELIELAPGIVKLPGIGEAFRQSLVWRALDAFSDGTGKVLNKLGRTEQELRQTLEVLLTVATIPGHPLNMSFLDQRLRKDSMPERDAWWSTYLHEAWSTPGPVNRIVDWASSVKPDMTISDETIDLCAIALAWMFTSSNRFLRDRATQALVILLTGRLPAVKRIIEHFADVDDPYVVERVYAVAYGTSMRSHNWRAVGQLAEQVYLQVFATDNPPPQILLRDYARGIVERALHLGSKMQVDENRLRPPYKSRWPTIPTEREIKQYLLDRPPGRNSHGDFVRAGASISGSVMDGDFGRYVIGVNHPTDWLSLKLDGSAWQPPEYQLRDLIADFSDEERRAWERFDEAKNLFKEASRRALYAQLDDEPGGLSGLFGPNPSKSKRKRPPQPDLSGLETKKNEAIVALNSELTREHAKRLKQIFKALNADDETRHPPRFDLRQVQRYILRRVFDLGWTADLFGDFDHSSIERLSIVSHKAERIGKKYQWIAYHEIMALVADHFQFWEQFRETAVAGNDFEFWKQYYKEGGGYPFDGPWQTGMRDIDPSCTMRSVPGGTALSGHAPSWWGPAVYNNWGLPEELKEWAARWDDLPNVIELLTAAQPTQGLRWINALGYFNWRQPTPVDQELGDVERGELRLSFTGYLIRNEDVQEFMEWAEGVDFGELQMPAPPKPYQMFLGEHGWAPAFSYSQQAYFGDTGWTQPDYRCGAKIRPMALEYRREAGGVDCSVDESYTVRLPVAELVDGMGLRWSGYGADFVDVKERLAASDPTVHLDGPSALLLREDLLRGFLTRKKFTICWAVIGEKRVLITENNSAHRYPTLLLSGAYRLGDSSPTGFLKCLLRKPPNKTGVTPPSTTLKVIRN